MTTAMAEKETTEEIKEPDPTGSKALVIRETNLTFADIQSMGDAFYKSGMFPTVKSAAQAVVKIQAGRELGLGPVYSMQHLYFVDGKLGMAAETMGALLKRGNKYNYRVKEHTDQKCSIAFYENGKEVYISTFTMVDARRAKLNKPGGAWEKYPRALLFSRALSQGDRIVAPDAGLPYTVEELESIEPDMPEVTPAEGVNTGTPTHTPAQVEEGSEPETQEVDSGNPYANYLYKCPLDDTEWEDGQYGKSHRTENKTYHNLNTIIREEADRLFNIFAGEVGFVSEKRAKGLAWFASEAMKEWLSCRNSDMPTWSRISDEVKVEILWALEKEVDAIGKGETSPLVEEAKKLGAVEVEE